MTSIVHYTLTGLIFTFITLGIGYTQPNLAMNQLAERYVKLVMAIVQHDHDYVDA